jgi:hypothetical protein
LLIENGARKYLVRLFSAAKVPALDDDALSQAGLATGQRTSRGQPKRLERRGAVVLAARPCGTG